MADEALFTRLAPVLNVSDLTEERAFYEKLGSCEATLTRTPHRYLWPAELDLMAQLAGFTLESRHADWTGTPFTADSPAHVSVYRLPA